MTHNILKIFKKAKYNQIGQFLLADYYKKLNKRAEYYTKKLGNLI